MQKRVAPLSLASWAARVGTSVPTLMRMEAGEAGVGMGLYATALWLVGRSGALAALAAPEHDRGALELDVRAAQSLGKARAQASAASRRSREQNKLQGLIQSIEPTAGGAGF